MLAAKGENRGKDTTDGSSTGGVGTAGGHWDEFLFDQELMTGYIDSDAYLSDMSIAALEDMGYETVYDAGLIV